MRVLLQGVPVCGLRVVFWLRDAGVCICLMICMFLWVHAVGMFHHVPVCSACCISCSCGRFYACAAVCASACVCVCACGAVCACLFVRVLVSVCVCARGMPVISLQIDVGRLDAFAEYEADEADIEIVVCEMCWTGNHSGGPGDDS